MNIVIYIPDLSQEWGGVRQYSIGLLKLCAEDKKNKYFIYHNNNDSEVLGVLENNPHFQRVQNADVIIKTGKYIGRKLRGAKNRIAKKFKIGTGKIKLSFIDTLCLQYKIDILHCPYQYIPPTKKVKLITTLHDLQEIHFPEFFTAAERAYRANAYPDFLSRADFVIVSYEHVKNDLIKYFKVEREKIGILLLKMENLWFDKFSEKDIRLFPSLHLPHQFLLYPANTWKHKNHLRLVEAIAIAKEKYHVIINVVCTGHKNDHFPEIDQLVSRLNVKDQVLFTGVVDEQVLYSLYKACRGVVIPTAYEAGSFPLYESIFLNVPVVCSNVTSLPETIGSDEFVFNAFDSDAIAQMMVRLWSDENFRIKNLNQLKLQAVKIKQNNPLPILQKIYEDL